MAIVIGSGIMGKRLAGGNAAQPRGGSGQWLVEGIATAGLVFVVLRAPAARVAMLVAAWIGAGYWFTASTSFANPAVTLGRLCSDSFAGIEPASVPGFMLAQGRGRPAAASRARHNRARPALKRAAGPRGWTRIDFHQSLGTASPLRSKHTPDRRSGHREHGNCHGVARVRPRPGARHRRRGLRHGVAMARGRRADAASPARPLAGP